MEKKSYKAEEGGHYGAKMTVMQPKVENVSSENVSLQEIKMISGALSESEQNAINAMDDDRLESEIKYTPVTKESYDGGKKLFLLDDEMAHFVPTKRGEEGMLCSNENYHNCDDYNTEFCRKRCEFAPKSMDDDIILPDIEPDK